MSSRHNQYIIIVMEYLSKWAKTNKIKMVNAKQIIIFLYKNIISHLGCPKILVSDIRSYFLNEAIEKMTKLFHINHQKTTPYHLQTNNLAERVNQILICML